MSRIIASAGWLLPRLALLAAVGLAVVLARAPAPLAGEQDWQRLAEQHGSEEVARQLELTMTNRVAALDGHTGSFTLTARGDRGGFARVHLQLDGFYVRVIPTLSQAKQGLIPYRPHYQDIYEIVPQRVAAQAALSVARNCVAPERTLYEDFNGSFTRRLVYPRPPSFESPGPEIPQWIYTALNTVHDELLQFGLRVESQQPAGRDAELTFNCTAFIPGSFTRRNGSVSQGRGRVAYNQTARSASTGQPNPESFSTRVGRVRWQSQGPVAVRNQFDLENFFLEVSGTGHYENEHCGPPPYRQESDREWRFDYRLTIQAKQEIKAVLRALDEDASSWLPEPGQERTFELTLEEPGPEQVEQVRFILEDVSAHPGVATNAGNHLGRAHCPHCTAPVEPVMVMRRTSFGHESGAPYVIDRSYVHYNDCALDQQPDLFFTDAANQGFDLPGGVSRGLRFTLGPEALLPEVETETVQVKVTVADWAATGRLRAQVMVGGVWHDARAEGPLAADDACLELPLDRDRNLLPDIWEAEAGVDEASADQEQLQGNPNTGDGLANLEEYRGVYLQSRHQRTDPLVSDVFVHDYSQRFGVNLDQLDLAWLAQGLRVRRVRGNEMRDDVVNYHVPESGLNRQYALVVMSLDQVPGLDWGSALGKAYVSPPCAEANTCIIRPDAGDFAGVAASLAEVLSASQEHRPRDFTTGVLGHELGHNLNLPHHGEGDALVDLASFDLGGSGWVACDHGQHSGRRDCFMAYRCATHHLAMDFVPASGITRWAAGLADRLTPYDQSLYGDRSHFCTDRTGDGVCGDARAGNCLGLIQVRSW